MRKEDLGNSAVQLIEKNTGIESAFIQYEARADPLSGVYDNKWTNTR